MKKITLFSLLLLLALLSILEQPTYASTDYNWYFDVTNTTKAHAQNIKGKGVNILVIDDGIDKTHSELVDLVSEGRLIFEGGVQENDLFDENNPFPHGTAMVSLIAGKTLGIAPESRVYFSKNDFSDSEKSIPRMIESIQWGIENDVDIISMSMSYSFLEEDLVNPDNELMNLHFDLEKKIQEAKNKGILFISSAGNISESDCYGKCESSKSDKEVELTFQQEYPEFSLYVGATDPSIESIRFPAKFSEVFAVGAVKQSEDNPVLYDRSNGWMKEIYPNDEWEWYASATGEKIDIVSPGTNVSYAMPNSFKGILERIKGYVENNQSPTTEDSDAFELYKDTYQQYLNGIEDHPNGDYYHRHYGGTSSATAITAGVAALYKQTHPSASAYELEQLLLNNAQTENIVDDDEHFDNQFGHGLVYFDTNSLTDKVVNYEVYNKSVYEVTKLFDNYNSNFVSFGQNSKLMYKFDVPINTYSFDISFYDKNVIQNIEINLYNGDRELIESKSVTGDSTVQFSSYIKDVEFFEIVNLQSFNARIAEFELYGESPNGTSMIKNISGEVLLKEKNKVFMENLLIPHPRFNVDGNYLKLIRGRMWDDDMQQFRWVQGSNSDIDVNEYWVKLDDSEMIPIYKNDLINTMYGQIVKDTVNYYGYYMFTDSYYEIGGLDSNKSIEYEFDQPVSINGLYLNLVHDTLDNQLKVTFTLSDGQKVYFDLKDKQIFQRYFEFNSVIKDVKKIELLNTHPTQTIRFRRFGIIGEPNEQLGNSAIAIEHPLTITKGSTISLYDSPKSKNFSKHTIGTNDVTYEVNKVFGYNGIKNRFEWALIEINGQLKWISTLDTGVNMPNVFENGAMDEVQGTIKSYNEYYGYYALDNSMYSNGILYKGGYIEYSFDSVVSASKFYIELGQYIDNSPSLLELKLYDESNNEIYSKTLSRNEFYQRLNLLDKEYPNIKKFKITNIGDDAVGIESFELKR